MTGIAANSQLFEEVIRPLLEQGLSVRFQARGASMSPAIRDGEMVEITPVIVCKLRKDDIVLAKSNNGFRLHRIVLADAARDVFITRGDCGQQDDPALKGTQILGLARAKEVRVGRKVVQARFRSVGGWMLRSAARAQYVCGKVLKKSAVHSLLRHSAIFVVGCLMVLAATSLRAQVAVDAESSGTATMTGTGNHTLQFQHTTTATANRVLIVGVSMNITAVTGTVVAGVTYNGTALNFVGAHNDAGNTRRVEMWYLTAPLNGGPYNVIVTVNLPTAGSVGVVGGAITFTGADQTAPLGTFASQDGAAGTYSQVDIPGVVNGMVLDTLSTDGTQTITQGLGTQTIQWNARSANNANPGVRGTSTTRSGAPSVPNSDTFSGTSNWSEGGVGINPSSADIGVTTSVSAVALGRNSTYNITVTNNGPSAAVGPTLTDAYASTGLSIVSVTPSTGTTCTTGTTISCTLPTPFASGAVATVAVVVSTTAAGFYPNTATVTDSGTPPDPNTGNDTYVALAPVVSVICGNSTLTAGGTLTGVVNTYYPGASSVSAGATSIPLGTANGTGTIAEGTELLVIQMQDASIDTSNSVAYGNGYTGQGFTTINNAGNYEFVTATGPISGGSVPILGAGVGGGLVFGYNAAAESATKGQSTYQVVLVPQYSSATLSSTLTAAAWNGSTGGILAIDVSGTLTLGGATVVVDGLGFRGGAGLELGGGGGAATDFLQSAPATYTSAPGPPANTTTQVGEHAVKGEGIAGTPAYVQSGGAPLATGTGYPSGTAGVDGSMARGAPGNAGGGGTDHNPQPAPPNGNTDNSGGGGGGNGGSGGFGGDSWNSNFSIGGEGGAPFPATIDRLGMGGGGGAGTRNNSNGDLQASSAAAGGGIVFIRAYNFSGTATITANGASAYNATANDAGGGGGAGGTIVMLAANGGEGGLTLQANGGNGGNAWESEAYTLGNRHGPGGGGAGGVVFVSGAPASISVAGGTNGLTENPGVPYGSTPGAAGVSATNLTMSQVTGMQSSEVCTRLPDLAITKSHGGVTFIRGTTASYTLALSNVSSLAATSGLVTVDDTLPLGVSPTSAAGTGWTCSVSGQTISCTRSDALAAGANYPSITVSANVSQLAPATLTNTGVVSGGGDESPLNDTSTDVANVASSADMAVTDAASPDPVAAGGNITYAIGVTNNGPSAADNATLVVPVPTNTTFVSYTAPSGWSCQAPVTGTGSLVCTEAGLAGGSPANAFTMVVKVAAGVANGTVITGNAQVTSSVSDPNSANNSATVTTIVGTSSPNLSVTNVASPNPVQAGNNITYTQVVTNTGATAITNGTFTEATPANTTLVSITPPAGWTCTGFPANPCTATTVAAGTSGTFTVVYTVASGTAAGTTITDTATVNATNQSFGANSATATDVVATATQADVALSTAGSPNPVEAGNNITYTQTITNNGPAAATGVIFTEATPTTTTFQSVLAPAGWSCTNPAVGGTGNVTCTDSANLASASAADIVVVVNVPSSVAAGNITANSSVTATTSDPNSSNNSTTVTTYVNNNCDLAVTNSASPNPVAVGADITYTQVITNSGPSACTAGTANEATPANTTFVSVAVVTTGGGTWTCPNAAPVACTNPSVPPGSTGTITAVYQVNAGTAAGTAITDTVTVATTTKDTNLNNNSAAATVNVTAAGDADLSVTNSGSPVSVIAGNNITYTQTVTNNGPAAATTPKLVETLPTGTTAVSLTGPTGWTCTLATLTCTDGTNLAATTTTTAFTFIVTVNSTTASGPITQTDTVSSTTTDPNSTNNSVTVTSLVTNSADLSVTNTASPIGVVANTDITYTQQVNNAGPSTATGVTLTETLPANTTAVSLTGPAGWVCTVATLTCTDTSLAPAAPATFTYKVLVATGTAAGTPISETASVTSSITDPNLANNTATANDVVALATQANLQVTNSATPTSVAAGSNVTYTQVITNTGPAAATTPTFTETTPPNTTYQSITIPAGWTCPTLPAVGGTGTISCQTTGGTGTIAVNGTASFTVVLQVVSGTPSGTNITDTATASAGNVVPGITTNTASATVVVANANSATLAITKTGTPNPVTEGTPLTYTIVVTNNGPATATTVTMTDTLPSTVTYLSSTTTQGSCSEAGGIVTCLLGTMANAATATISILTLPNAVGTISNTATVTSDQSSPVSSTWVETVTTATLVRLLSFSAHYGTDKNGANRVLLLWRTGGEAHNLGFNVYRELNGNKVRLNPSVIAGSALLMSGALPKHAARSYAWIDPTAGVAGASYWLEDVDVNGTRSLHGPVSATAGTETGSDLTASETRMLSQLNQALPPAPGSQQSHLVETFGAASTPTSAQVQTQFELAAHPAVKIAVRHEGWYRVGQPALVKAGLDPNVDPASLRLYAEAIEQPMQITGATPGPGGFGPQASISFYGTAIDTVFSGTRVYWLVSGRDHGARIPQLPTSSGSNQPPADYWSTVELRQHTIYFSALITSNGQNFFGALVSSTPVEQVLDVPHLDTASTRAARLEVSLQGIITAFPHDVAVSLNGTSMGDVIFMGQNQGTLSVSIPAGVLQPSSNTVTLTAQNGEYDTSLVNYVRIAYPHSYVADSDQLKFTGRAGDEIVVSNFTSAPVVLDITDPNRPVQLTPQVTSNEGNYTIALQVPFTTTNPASRLRHTLLAVGDDQISSAPGIWANHPSHWHTAQPGADIAIVTYGDFAETLVPLVHAHQADHKSSVVVPVGDLYDEFNFGEHSPFAIKQFLYTAAQNWRKPPTYLLLNGRASLDPRNYLGFGDLDLVPTRIVPTASLMTASDDWFSDFNNSGLPTIATGRLPVSTTDDAAMVIGKIASYEGQSTGSWTSNALFVADKDDTESFTQDSQTVQGELPAGMQATDVFVDNVGTTGARGDIISAINSGEGLVNYLGHGSEEQWAGADIFDETSVNSLTNGSQLPVFFIMDCLNGYFQDVYAQPLGVTLVLAPSGGAVAVLASSGLNQAPPQTNLDALVVQNAFNGKGTTLGDAVVSAKSQITDPDVRRTFILFGDPAMHIKQPSTSSAP